MSVRERIEWERRDLAKEKEDDLRLQKRLGWDYNAVHRTAFGRGYITGAEEGLAEGRAEARTLTAKMLTRAGLTQWEIAKLLKTSQSTVSRLLGKEG